MDIPFSKRWADDTARPWLPVTITNPRTRKKIKTFALIDTGADEYALPAVYAPSLGYDLQHGIPKSIDTGNGATCAYSHKVQIQVRGLEPRNTLIDFMPNLQVPLLGTKNFLSEFVLTIDYPQSKFSLQRQ